GQGLSLLTSTRISLRDHHLELVDLQGRVAAAARGATGNVRLVSTESESVIEPPTCATGARARPAPTATASRPRPRRPRSARGSRTTRYRLCLRPPVPSWRPFGSWSPRSQRQVVIIASTRIRHSPSRP